jgi:hypothetical protein
MLSRAVFSAAEFEFGSLFGLPPAKEMVTAPAETKLEAKKMVSKKRSGKEARRKRRAGDETAEGRRQKTRVGVVYNRVIYMLSRARAERLWVQTQSVRAFAQLARDSAPKHVQNVEIRSHSASNNRLQLY